MMGAEMQVRVSWGAWCMVQGVRRGRRVGATAGICGGMFLAAVYLIHDRPK